MKKETHSWPVPDSPKIYHIVHVNLLASIVETGALLCNADVNPNVPGTDIGMKSIKKRRLKSPLRSHDNLCVGDCVPFYFCPRSVMLFLLDKGNHPGLSYGGGQGPIIHLQADLYQVVAWAKQNNRRWVFTLFNAGSGCIEERCDLSHLGEIDWPAVDARDWEERKREKQAEFLIERRFPWNLVSFIGVRLPEIGRKVDQILHATTHRPDVEIKRDWYY